MYSWFFILDRCQLWDKELEIKEMQEQLKELVGLLRQSEVRRKEVEKELKLREQAVAIALATSASVRLSLLSKLQIIFKHVKLCINYSKILSYSATFNQTWLINQELKKTLTSTLEILLLLLSILSLLSGLQQGNSPNSLEHFNDEMSAPLSPIPAPAHKQIKYTAGIANGSIKESASFVDRRKVRNFPLLGS